jgi:comEA protein
MSSDSVNRLWLLLTAILIVIILIGGIIIWNHRDNGRELQIINTPPLEFQSELSSDNTGKNPLPQQIDINRADVWLLQALPDIGETRAKAIVEYRLQNGLFRMVEDITSVPGIGASVFEKIKPYITVSGN